MVAQLPWIVLVPLTEAYYLFINDVSKLTKIRSPSTSKKWSVHENRPNEILWVHSNYQLMSIIIKLSDAGGWLHKSFNGTFYRLILNQRTCIRL